MSQYLNIQESLAEIWPEELLCESSEPNQEPPQEIQLRVLTMRRRSVDS